MRNDLLDDDFRLGSRNERPGVEITVEPHKFSRSDDVLNRLVCKSSLQMGFELGELVRGEDLVEVGVEFDPAALEDMAQEEFRRKPRALEFFRGKVLGAPPDEGEDRPFLAINRRGVHSDSGVHLIGMKIQSTCHIIKPPMMSSGAQRRISREIGGDPSLRSG